MLLTTTYVTIATTDVTNLSTNVTVTTNNQCFSYHYLRYYNH
jgi:hypothetical protein